VLPNLAVGHDFDWDINNNNLNKTGYFPEAIPPFLGNSIAAAQFATDVTESVFVGSLSFVNRNKHPNLNVIPQAAGGTFYSNSSKITGLTSGIQIQTNDITDIQYMIGIQFIGPIATNDTLECIICTGFGKTKSELAIALLECIESEITSITDAESDWYRMRFANGLLEVSLFLDEVTIEIFNILGEKLLTQSVSFGDTIIDINNFPHSVYFVRLHSNNKVAVLKVVN